MRDHRRRAVVPQQVYAAADRGALLVWADGQRDVLDLTDSHALHSVVDGSTRQAAHEEVRKERGRRSSGCEAPRILRVFVYRRIMTDEPQHRSIRSRHVSQVIQRPAAKVYDFAADPDNLSKWAAGLAQSQITREGDMLVADSPIGRVTVRLIARNNLGVLDHDVTLPSGTTVNNPMRVLTHPDGSEVVFTVRQIELTDEEFERDVQLVAEDLLRLKNLLERSS